MVGIGTGVVTILVPHHAEAHRADWCTRVVESAGVAGAPLPCRLVSVPAPELAKALPTALTDEPPAWAVADADVVILRPGTEVPQGWLSALREAAHADERTAAVFPVCLTLPTREGAADALAAATAALAGLPLTTPAPAAAPPCLLLRGDLLPVVGFAPPLPGDADLVALLHDFAMRAQARGLLVQRANRVPVAFVAPDAPDGPVPLSPRLAALLSRRHPHLQPQLRRFQASVESALPAHALRLAHPRGGRRLRVALDLRHVADSQRGTQVYAHHLAQALCAHPEVDLSVVVLRPAQAQGLDARVLQVSGGTERERPLSEVEIIHRPAQVYDPADLALLFDSPAHVVITHQDLIAHHAQGLLPSADIAVRYRATSHLALSAAQGVLAISHAAARELAVEFDLPLAEIAVVHQGVDTARLCAPRERPAYAPPGDYFLAVGSDYPHKNLSLLLAAYRRLRATWPTTPPSLVLCGPATGPNGTYAALRAGPASARAGVALLHDVDDPSLAALYQHALALVFPSVYEGFGLPPIEAMAAGAPVIALPISAMPEVCGDAAHYPAALSPAALCAAMTEVATDAALRARLREAGARRAAGYSWTRTAEETLRAYERVVRSPSPRSLRARRHLGAVLPPAAFRGAEDESDRMLGWARTQALYHPHLFRLAALPAFALWRGAGWLRDPRAPWNRRQR